MKKKKWYKVEGHPDRVCRLSVSTGDSSWRAVDLWTCGCVDLGTCGLSTCLVPCCLLPVRDLLHASAAPRLRPLLSSIVALLLVPMMVLGCASSGRSTREVAQMESVLRLTQQVGGTHYRTIVRGDAWLQTFGHELLVLEPRSARLLDSIPLGRVGEVGAAVDMADLGDRLLIVLEGDAVVELNIEEPRRPRFVETVFAGELGIAPQRVSAVGDEFYISGVGGVVRWSDAARIYRNPGSVSHVVMSDEGLVACVGRRIYRLEDGQFVGSASDLVPAQGLDVMVAGQDPSQMIIFSRQNPEGALVGLLGSNLRELDSRNLTIAVPGMVRSVRAFGQRLWIVTDSQISAYVVEQDALVLRRHVDVLGARDLASLDENHLAIAGSFGRAIYRANRTERGPGDTFFQVHREPSRLTDAKWDGRRILAGSEEGSWLYLIGSRVEPSNEPLDRSGPPLEPPTSASAASARARISEDRTTLSITTEEGVFEHVEPQGAMLHCVIAVEGEFWLGHDRGITVLHARLPAIDPRSRPPAGRVGSGETAPSERVIKRLRIDGPVRYLFPMRIARGAAYVSEFGGFGTLQWEEVPIEPGTPH